MPRFKVRIARMEEIDFELEADSEMDAMERYLSDGEETSSRTLDTNILYVEEIGEVEYVRGDECGHVARGQVCPGYEGDADDPDVPANCKHDTQEG